MNTLTAVSLIYAQGFQFPSNGKAYPKPLPNFPTPRFFTLCFNSLQTGKRIQSCNSNIMVIRMRHTVSIPFKRESVSKEDSALFHSVLKVQGFNSLQTGKRIQRHSLKDSGRSVSDCVSIPFKRESVSKGEKLKKVLKATATLKFQFPSNGKAYPKIATARSIRLTIALTVVSIPFKRESVSKVLENHYCQVFAVALFQFPSNGKAYPKSRILANSVALILKFQFPSNGKAYPKGRQVATSM